MPETTAPAPDKKRRTLPLPAEGVGSLDWWESQTQWSRDISQPLLEQKWRPNIKAYVDEVQAARSEAVRVNIDFEKTEQKKHQLFFRVPVIRLKASPRTMRDAQQAPQPEQPPVPGQPPAQPQPRDLKAAIRVFEEVLKHEAGEKGINSKPLMDELIFDVLCPAGIAACKVGYERTVQGTVPVQIGTEPDPNFEPPQASVLGLQPVEVPQVPVMGEAPNIVDERYFASRISPGDLLIPAEFSSKDYNKADWLGHDFDIAVHEAERRGWAIPPEMREKGGNDDFTDTRLVELQHKGRREGQLRCTEIFYYAARVDPKVAHPRKIRRLIFIKGVNEPALHEDLRDQTFDERGRFVKGIDKLPIKVLTLRYVSDSHHPPSDCSISRRTSDELSEFRTQMVVHRRKGVPLRWVNLERIINPKVRDLVEKGEYYDIIPVEGDGNQTIGEVSRPQYPRENFGISEAIMNDANRLWALGANQSATRETAGTTATEVAAIEKATANRLSGEQEVVMNFWLSIMESIGRLKQLYADREDYVEVVGEEGATLIEAWDKDTIRGEFIYTIQPDSSQKRDTAAERDLALNRYNLLANDPYINRKELVRNTVEVFGGDPDRLLTDPPQPEPEKPRVSASFKGDDLNPSMPQYTNVTTVLRAAGLPAEGLQQPEQPELLGPEGDGQAPEEGETGPAGVVDRERLRMALADNQDGRAGAAGLEG